MIGAIAILLALVLLFTVLVLVEWCGGDGEANDTNTDVTNNDSGELGFKTVEISVPSEDLHTGDLILINSTYKYKFPQQELSVIPIINGRTVHGQSASGNPIYSYYTQNGIDKCARLESEALTKLGQWADAFYAATQKSDLFVLDSDGYRSEAAQQKLDPSLVGVTEHHTGKVIDLYVYTGKIRGNMDDEEFYSDFKWIYENAYTYGFVLRYPAEKASVTGVDYEPYHFRQVGYAHAYYMYKNGLCLEEYLDKVKTHTVSAPLVFEADDGNTYMVYYQSASGGSNTELAVPEEYTYTISGDNREGFVVTVKVEK